MQFDTRAVHIPSALPAIHPHRATKSHIALQLSPPAQNEPRRPASPPWAASFHRAPRSPPPSLSPPFDTLFPHSYTAPLLFRRSDGRLSAHAIRARASIARIPAITIHGQQPGKHRSVISMFKQNKKVK